MSGSTAITGVDLNDARTLELYTKVWTFSRFRSVNPLSFPGLDNAQQRALQAIAHHFGLEYEFTLLDRTARVSQSPAPDAPQLHSFSEFSPISANDFIAPPQPEILASFGNSDADDAGWCASLDSLCDAPGIWVEPFYSTPMGRTSMDSPGSFDPGVDFTSGYYDVEGAQSPFSPYTAQVPAHRASSRASSVGSMQSTHSRRGRSRIRDTFSRRASSGYEEIVFDANPSRASSRASGSRTRRAMNAIEKAAMSAVKAVRACWKCKILRDRCSPETPCNNCPKSSSQKSDWQGVGCKRGGLEDETPRSLLCPNTNMWISFLDPNLAEHNTSIETLLAERDAELKAEDMEAIIYDYVVDPSMSQGLESSSGAHNPLDVHHAIWRPLAQSVMAIEWELRQIEEEAVKKTPTGAQYNLCERLKQELDRCVPNFKELLRSAARYQAQVESHQLVAQSLICLRHSLEMFRIQRAGLLQDSSHSGCSFSQGCKIEMVTDLDININSYMKELSRLFFASKPVPTIDMWLPTFYSLCLQGYARRILCTVAGDRRDLGFPGSYLHLPVRLFTARFANYDPLPLEMSTQMQPNNTLSTHLQRLADTVHQAECGEQSTRNASSFLKALCQDNGETLSSYNRLSPEELMGSMPSSIPSSILDMPIWSPGPSLGAPAQNPLSNAMESPKLLPLHGLMGPLHGSPKPRDLGSNSNELPDLFASTRKEPTLPPPEDLCPDDPDLVPTEQEARFDGDLYGPRYVRGLGNKRESWCGFCEPGRWLVLKNSAYWYDRTFTHGISSTTGKEFEPPQECRQDVSTEVWEGLCASCGEWIYLVSSKKKGITWFRHAYKCQTPWKPSKEKRRRVV